MPGLAGVIQKAHCACLRKRQAMASRMGRVGQEGGCNWVTGFDSVERRLEKGD